jgi:hypothetical protein
MAEQVSRQSLLRTAGAVAVSAAFPAPCPIARRSAGPGDTAYLYENPK